MLMLIFWLSVLRQTNILFTIRCQYNNNRMYPSTGHFHPHTHSLTITATLSRLTMCSPSPSRKWVYAKQHFFRLWENRHFTRNHTQQFSLWEIAWKWRYDIAWAWLAKWALHINTCVCVCVCVLGHHRPHARECNKFCPHFMIITFQEINK